LVTRLLAGTVLQSDLAFWLMMRLARRTVVEDLLGTPYEIARRANSAERERLEGMLRNLLPVSLRRKGLCNDGAVVSALQPFELEKIEAPALAISVEDDRYGTFQGAQYTAGRIRNARFVGFRTGGHLWLGHHAEVSRAVREFLQAMTQHQPAGFEAAGPAGR
jgi:pimeloyl-ACP methyl ester carboxylesterase